MQNRLVNKVKSMSKKEWKLFCFNFLLITLGSFLLAFGVGVFLTENRIVSGGLSGIAIILQYYFNANQIIDIVVWIATGICWVLGLIFIGLDFSLKTLIASIAYPLFLTLITRNAWFINLAKQVAGTKSTADILICAIFSGVFVGGGVALTFLGGGSTGGFDTFIHIANKYLRMKPSIASFILDAIVIILSLILIPNNLIPSLCGIISAFIAALMISFLYEGNHVAQQADIISTHWEEISDYVQNDLGRGATIIPVKGGYKHSDKIMLRVVLNKIEAEKLKSYISKIDEKAFVTYTQTKAVIGEGFISHQKREKMKKNKDLQGK